MTSYPNLKNAPIKEIIFAISFNGNVTLPQLEQFIHLPEIKEKFPVIGQGFHTQITQLSDNKPPRSTSSLEGFVLRSQAPSRILHIKRGSLAFHKVNGYEPFENLFEEINNYWILFRDFTKVESIGNLSLRYVNFIESIDSEIDNLLSIKLTHPFTKKLEGFFNQIRFKYEPNPSIDVNVVVSKARDKERSGIVLDIILNKKLTSHIELKDFLGMREVKNKVFFDCITQEAINKFNS